MYKRLAAQSELVSAIHEAHQSVAMTALRGIGVVVSAWSEVETRSTEVAEAITAFKTTEIDADATDQARDEWDMCIALYDPVQSKPTYPVPLLGHDRVSLVMSETPTDVIRPSGYGRESLAYVTHPLKYVQVDLRGNNQQTNSALVYVSPDSPATAIHGDDVRYVQARDAEQRRYHMDSMEIPLIVSQTFGEDAVSVLSDEACLSLAAAIRSAAREPVTEVNHQFVRYI